MSRITWPGVVCLGLVLAFAGASAQLGWGGEKGAALIATLCTAIVGVIGVFVKGLERPDA